MPPWIEDVVYRGHPLPNDGWVLTHHGDGHVYAIRLVRTASGLHTDLGTPPVRYTGDAELPPAPDWPGAVFSLS